MIMRLYNNRFPRTSLDVFYELVPTEKKKIEKRYIRGFPERIKGNITSSKPATLHEAINMARELVRKAVQGSKERLASPNPSTPTSCLRWSPTGRMFDLKGKIIATVNLSVNMTVLKVIMLVLLTLRNLSTKGFQVQLSLCQTSHLGNPSSDAIAPPPLANQNLSKDFVSFSHGVQHILLSALSFEIVDIEKVVVRSSL
ncbi:hypothetical protein Tco_0568842 [Tanacetum coccineum]